MRLRLIAFAIATLTAARAAIAAPEIPGAPQSQPIAIVGGTVHPVSGPAIEGGTVLFDGKITAVGKDIAIPDGAERIDAAGKHVYPGLIDAFTQLGLIEIESVRATLDQNEVGAINPNVSARLSFNPDSELIPVARSGGVLTVATAPTGGLFAGLTSVMHLDGWTHEDMTLKADVGTVVNWPSMAPVFTPFTEQSAEEQLHRRDAALKILVQTLADARAYRAARLAAAAGGPEAPFDIRLEALLPVVEGRLPLFVRADETQQIQAATALAAKEQLKLVLVGGYDAMACVDLLKRYDVPVIVTGVHRLPQRADDDYDASFTLPHELHRAGVRYCIALGDAASNLRNLSHHAGTAAAFGLPADEALKAITLNAAEILGVADRIGTLDAGKDATLIVTDGDVLEIATRVEGAYIQGRRVDLSDRHKRLWQKYQEKYRRAPYAPAQ